MRLLLLAVAVALAGCAGDDNETAPATTASTMSTASSCTKATAALMTPLANKVMLADAQLTNPWIVKSAEQDDVYFVAAEIDSPDLRSTGDVAVWATSNPTGGAPIYSVDRLARRSSEWPDAAETDIAADDPAIAESRSCVSR